MPLVIFAFSIDTEMNEATFAGTIEPPAALTLLQQLVIADAVKKAGRRLDSESSDEKRPG